MTPAEQALERARANAESAAKPVEVRDDAGLWRTITAQPTQSENPEPFRYAVRVMEGRA